MVDRFINAAKDGYVDILREGTKRDLNSPDEDGMTATLWAAHSGNLEALRLIVGREGDVNKADYLGMTALHHAAMRGHISIVSYLLNWGCNVYALDNDLHSALELAAMYNRHEIVRLIDSNVAEKQSKNPKQAARMKEEAIKTAEINIKRYEKLSNDAARKAEKEHRKMQSAIDQQLNQQNGIAGDDTKKKSLFKTLTLGRKGGSNSSHGKWDTAESKSVFSSAAGMSDLGKKTGLNKKIQIRRLESITPKPGPTISEFKVSNLDDSRNRTVRSMKGIVGPTSEVLYVAGDVADKKGRLSLRGKSESEFIDSEIDSNYGEEDEQQNKGGMLNRPEFGTLTFLSKSPFLNTVHSFDDYIASSTRPEFNGDSRYLSGEYTDIANTEKEKGLSQAQALPWNEDDLGNLDDEEDEAETSELSAVNMFLWSCGLASYLHIFAQEKIDMQVLTMMTDSELKELGLPFGPRKKLLDAIARRKTVLETPTKMIDTRL